MSTCPIFLVRVEWGVPRTVYRHQFIFMVQGGDADRDGPRNHQSSNLAASTHFHEESEKGSDCLDVLHRISVRSFLPS